MAPRKRTSDCTYLLILAAVFSLILFSVSIAALAASIEVNSADPPEMEQSQTIDVIIKGNGFDMSAAAKFLVSGTKKTGGVTVNSTTFIDAQTLRANVTAAPDAVVGDFDIQIQLSKGRRGKGIELFNVKAATNQGETGGCEGDIRATFRDFLGDSFTPPDRVRSDGLGPYIGGELEVDNVGISRWMFRIGLGFGSGDPLDRQFTLDFSECASPGECTPPTPPTDPMSFNSPFMAPSGALGVKRNKEINPDVNFCTMANGATLGGILGFIRFYTKDDPDREWFVTFGPIGSKKARKEACSGSSFLFAHRVNENTWEFGLGPDEVGCLTRDAARGGGFSFHGLYRMRFLVTAERLP